MKNIIILAQVIFSIFKSIDSFAEMMALPGVDNCQIDISSQGNGSKGDIVFFPGFADCYKNHQDYFDSLVGSGFRVISFNYPEHFGSKCDGKLNFETIRTSATAVVQKYGRSGKPLYVSGWSTGGLIAAMSAQDQSWFSGRTVAGSVLLAPAMVVKKQLPKKVDPTTLAPGGSLACPIMPEKPEVFGLGGEILKNSVFANNHSTGVKTLVIMAPDSDQYINAPAVKRWANKYPSDIHGYQCNLPSGATFHGVDLVPEVKGEAIALASDYFTSLSADGAANYRMKTDGTNCKAFTTQSFRQTPVRKRGMSQEVKSSGDEQDGPVDAK